MKKSYIYLTIGLIAGGIILSPAFVLAANICYVDEKVKDGGDGSNDEPYKKISEATKKDCGEIKISKGTYKENVVLKKSVKLKGSSRDDVIIMGKVTMGDNSEISKLTVDGGGIDIQDGANTDIENVKVKNANIGILTVGKGRLSMDNVLITRNRKGMYVQYGKEIKIINCKVYENDEEGIDIRANVDGSINNNEIYNNGESGIEIILGKSTLSIFNNSIRKNKSSGIASQFYSDTADVGKVSIKNNMITENSNYGLDCKAPSGSDGRQKGYWEKSMELDSNKITGNKKEEIAGACKFNDGKVESATKTKEEREAEKIALEEKEKQAQLSLLEKQKLEELKAQQEEEARILQNDNNEKSKADDLSREFEDLYQANEGLKIEIENRNKFLIFIIGEDYKKIKKMKNDLYLFDEKIEAIEDRKNNLVNEDILSEVDIQLSILREKRESIVGFIENQGDKFSLLGWFFRKN